jgi:hypothetical protein
MRRLKSLLLLLVVGKVVVVVAGSVGRYWVF